jgi:NDP-sugar pyrophosphorylase family protein
MNIDNLLILAAGHGTRMGKVGEILPKPLWPIFDMPLLQAQILFWKKFNPKKIFINTHHCGDKIVEFVKGLNDPSIVLLEEKKLLGSGGPFYTVKKLLKDNDELLWAVNADSLSDISSELVEKVNGLAKKNHGVLIAQAFSESENYNRFILNKGKLTAIKNKAEPFLKNEERITFSGISCFNLAKMDLLKGPQNFFETVANFKEKDISVIGPFAIETYDFGTIDNYIKEHLVLSNIVNQGPTSFVSELMNLGIVPSKEKIMPYQLATAFEITEKYQLKPSSYKSEKIEVSYGGYSSISLIQSTGQACSHS